MTPYTHGVWRTKPGRGEEFVAAWTEFAQWTSRSVDGAGRGVLLRDMSDPTRFISVGPWRDVAAIEAWRANPGWRERVERIRELLDGFEASTLEMVAEEG